MIVPIAVLILFMLFVAGSASATEITPGVIHEVETHLGKVKVRIVGENIPGRVPVVCIPGMSEALIDEWTKVAEPLSQHGFVVAIIHFHSNPRTAPALFIGGIQPPDVSKIINEAVLKQIFNAEKGVILGKSWGGYMAVMHTINNPDKVIKLAVQAPAFSTRERVTALHKTGVPTLLAWAKDDWVVWYSTHEMWQSVFGSDLTFYSTDKGGHAVVDDYAGPILKFLQS